MPRGVKGSGAKKTAAKKSSLAQQVDRPLTLKEQAWVQFRDKAIDQALQDAKLDFEEWWAKARYPIG